MCLYVCVYVCEYSGAELSDRSVWHAIGPEIEMFAYLVSNIVSGTEFLLHKYLPNGCMDNSAELNQHFLKNYV